jgi:hypothetical protein
MVQHIYGNKSVLGNINRPNLFLNELKMYVDYLQNEIGDIANEITSAQIKKLQSFKNNLIEGIEYYVALFTQTKFFKTDFVKIQNQLHEYKNAVLSIQIPQLEMA